MIKFDLFTYQISPDTTDQTKLIFKTERTLEELIAEKNKLFYSVFLDKINFYNRGHKLNFKIEYIDPTFILIRLANKRSVKIEKQFQKEYYESEPSCLIAFHNDPKVQLIAIESDKSSFSSSFTVLKVIEKTIDRALNEYSLNFYPQPKYEPSVFWDIINKNEGRIERIKFEFTKPNLGRVNEAISEDLKAASKILNSASTKVEFEAPKNQTLENVNQENPVIKDFVKASSEGAGPAKVKLKGVRIWETTENAVKTFEFDDLEIEANDKIINSFVNALKSKMKGG